MKKIIIIILAALNAVLLGLIIVSAATGWQINSGKDRKKELPDNMDGFTYPEYDPEDVELVIPTGPIVRETTAQPSETIAPSALPTEAPINAPTEAPTVPSTSAATQPSVKPPVKETAPSQQDPYSYVPGPGSMSTDYPAKEKDANGFLAKKGWTKLSSDKEYITDLSLLTGGWKAVMISDPDKKRGDTFTDYMNIDISVGQSGVAVKLNWNKRVFDSDGKSADVSGSPSSLTGSFDKGTLSATGSGAIKITDFCYDFDKGVEYAYGTYTWPDGVEAYVGLLR